MTGETKNKNWISKRDKGKTEKLVITTNRWNILEKPQLSPHSKQERKIKQSRYVQVW